ncbi:MAG: exo-alpha-sialidase [Bacteroidaceae bacterium]|nr:exo-alpha-sialidase [Bacteroidaceae bacterium]
MKSFLTIITCALAVTANAQVRVFEYGSKGHDICYRIPAIATASNGDVISVADYRYCGSDIGYGRLSLHARISHDNGYTWGPLIVVAEAHEGKYGVNEAHDAEAGFGDPAIVADRESGNVLLLSCCGNVTYQAGTSEHHQGIARFRSSDNGRTWSKFEDIAPAIYQMFRDSGVSPEALFIGSGRIFQSRYVKVNDCYRLYCVVLMRTKDEGGLNYVIYSDDFGESWAMLGGVGVTGGDEPKAEELPNGDVLLSSRWWGRIFNIFHFTDARTARGEWMEQAKSNVDNAGVVAEQNACNGEIMILPVVRNADGKDMWLALQSIPFGPQRANVGIYYKGMATPADYSTPQRFASFWEGRHQVSKILSAYSTMTQQKDGTIGFLYEESTFGKDYSIIYKNLSVETITGGAYRAR